MKQVSVEIIHKCPNHCIHCSSFSGMDCTMKIPKEKVFDIIDGMEKIKAEVLSISGGEPFLHEGLLEIVRYAKKKEIQVYLYTSGIMLDHAGRACDIENALLDGLKKAGADRIIFDLPAVDEDVYNNFMGTSGYLKYVLKSIESSVKKEIFTEIHFVPTKINADQIDKILFYADKEKVNQVSFLGLIPHGRAAQIKETLYLTETENYRLKQKLHTYQSKNIRIGIPLQMEGSEYKCYAGQQKLCVRYDGKVFGCEAFKYITLNDDEGKVIEPDTIYEKNLDDIYYHSLYLKQERNFIARQMKNCDCGEKCPVQRMMRKAV